MISSVLGHFLDRPLLPIAKRIRINPNLITLSGFVVTLTAAFVIPGNLRLGGLLVLAGGLFDALDGIVARTNGRTTRFGAFLDSLLDRLSDSLIFISLALYLYIKGDLTGALLSLGAMVGAFLISYARARAEGLGIDNQAGLLERPERIILIIFGALTGWLNPVLWLMIILTYFTVFQRTYRVWKTDRKV